MASSWEHGGLMATPQNMHSNSIPSMPKGFTMVYDDLQPIVLWTMVNSIAVHSEASRFMLTHLPFAHCGNSVSYSIQTPYSVSLSIHSWCILYSIVYM